MRVPALVVWGAETLRAARFDAKEVVVSARTNKSHHHHNAAGCVPLR
jgi:hypothetical protein